MQGQAVQNVVTLRHSSPPTPPPPPPHPAHTLSIKPLLDLPPNAQGQAEAVNLTRWRAVQGAVTRRYKALLAVLLDPSAAAQREAAAAEARVAQKAEKCVRPLPVACSGGPVPKS